jgi:hypothetical protein
MSFGVYDNSAENEKAIARFNDAKRTGMVRPHQKDEKMNGSIKAYLDRLSGPKRFSEGQLTRNQGVNQCKWMAGGDAVIGPNGTPCGYGIQLPQEMSGLVDATNLKKNDVVLFKVNLIIPAGEKLTEQNVSRRQELTKKIVGNRDLWNQIDYIESMAQYYYFTEGQIEGLIEEVYPNSSLLGNEGIIYRVIPMSTRLSKDAQEAFATDSQNGARDMLRSNTEIKNVGLLNKNVTDNYIPMKIGKLPIVYWLGVYNDMKTAQVVVTTNYTTYKQLEENLYTQSERVMLGSFPVTEVTHQKHRTLKAPTTSSSTRPRQTRSLTNGIQ